MAVKIPLVRTLYLITHRYGYKWNHCVWKHKILAVYI